jgi:hypothetical protein
VRRRTGRADQLGHDPTGSGFGERVQIAGLAAMDTDGPRTPDGGVIDAWIAGAEPLAEVSLGGLESVLG